MDTWVLNLGGAPGSTGNYTWSSSDLSNYSGFFYYAMGAGGEGSNYTANNQSLFGGGSGFVDAGYIDLTNPYSVTSITAEVLNQSNSLISISYSNSPSSSPFVIQVDPSQTSNNVAIAQGITISNRLGAAGLTNYPIPYVPIGFYAGQMYNENYSNNIFNGTKFSNMCDQRGNIGNISGNLQTFGATGYLNSDLFGVGGNGLYAGGGYYGGSLGVNGVTGPYGYGSGGTLIQSSNVVTSGSDGYIVISFIKKSSTNNGYFYSSSSGNGTSPSGILIGSILGGGGGGSGNWDSDSIAVACGGGSGNPGLMINNVLNNSTYYYSVGAGGSGGSGSGNASNGKPGEKSVIVINGITGYANPGDGVVADFNDTGGFGGAGYYGGGSAQSTVDNPWYYGGFSCSGMFYHYGDVNIWPANNNAYGNGAGSVDYNVFGQGIKDSGGVITAGGGGGPYAGSGYDGSKGEYINAQGYGCGGGGGSDSTNGGNGSGGYVLTRTITDSTNFKLITVSNGQSITLKYLDLMDYTGFWYFLSQGGNSLPLTNMGHFLIKQDGVKGIQLSFNNNSGTITVAFNPISLNGGNTTYPQTFQLSSAPPFLFSISAVTQQDLGGGYTPPSYSAILLYKGTVNPS